MTTDKVFMILEKLVSKLQEALDDEWGLKKVGALAQDVKRHLFELCEQIDEDGLDDGNESEVADIVTDVIDMVEDLIGEIEDKEISEEDAYDEISDIIDALNDMME